MSEEAEMATRPVSGPGAATGTDVVSGTGLREGVLHIAGVVMQNIANIAPAIAVLFTVQQIASYAGVAAPLAYLIAFLVTLCLGTTLGQLVRKLPSAGSYYTFIYPRRDSGECAVADSALSRVEPAVLVTLAFAPRP